MRVRKTSSAERRLRPASSRSRLSTRRASCQKDLISRKAFETRTIARRERTPTPYPVRKTSSAERRLRQVLVGCRCAGVGFQSERPHQPKGV